MKRSMIVGVTNEDVIHPKKISSRLKLERSKIEKLLLKEKLSFINSACPACQGSKHLHAFDINGFAYQQCENCQSVFMSPRPNPQQLGIYYHDSDYANFLASNDYKKAIEKFNTQLLRHRADQIIINNQKIKDSKNCILLYAPKSDELELILKSHPNMSTSSIPAFSKIDLSKENKHKFDIIAAFDILERLPDPLTTIKHLISKLKVGGRILITLRSGSGFDLMTLWGDLDLVPVEHMNLMTLEGVTTLMTKCNLDIQEVSTPGQLDVQIVERISLQKNVSINRFSQYLLKHRDKFTKDEFQQFLQKGLLSSHMYLVGIKK